MLKSKREFAGITKVCSKCKEPRDTSLFNYNPAGSSRLNSWCRLCDAISAKKYYWSNVQAQREKAKIRSRERAPWILKHKADNPGTYLCMLARRRAKVEGIPFSLTPEDIVIPTHCPVLGLKLEFSYGKHATDVSPTLDKFVPELGYIPSNITVISKKANRLKGDGSLQDIQNLLDWMKGRHSK